MTKKQETNLSDHPIQLTKELIQRYTGELQFQFSKYTYVPQSVVDQRDSFVVKGSNLTDDYLVSTLDSLNKQQELAFHSLVKLPTTKMYHIPMIDFSGNGIQTNWQLFHSLLPSNILEEFHLYDSGRSFHGYSLHLLSQTEWVKFMAKLLLLNLPNQTPVVDSRWIGHRLTSGFGSLRWSHNTEYYQKMPKKVTFDRQLNFNKQRATIGR